MICVVLEEKIPTQLNLVADVIRVAQMASLRGSYFDKGTAAVNPGPISEDVCL